MIDYSTNIKLEHTIPDAKDLKEIYYTIQARKDAKELFEKEICSYLSKGKDCALKIFDRPINITDVKSTKRLFALKKYLEDRGYKITFCEKMATQKDIKERPLLEYISMKIEWEF